MDWSPVINLQLSCSRCFRLTRSEGFSSALPPGLQRLDARRTQNDEVPNRNDRCTKNDHEKCS
eukprot:5555212-Amphidinium_carterae.1